MVKTKDKSWLEYDKYVNHILHTIELNLYN